jgi:hypothetical protein
MIRSCNLILSCFIVGLMLNASAQQSGPAASAPPPPVGTLAGHPGWPAAKNPGDVDTGWTTSSQRSYDVVSGPAGQRDWDRFRALFLPDGRIVSLVPESAATKDRPARKGDAIFLTPDMFAQRNDSYLKANGFFERSIANRVEEFGNLIEVVEHVRNPGREGRCPAILARHRFVPDCACSRTLPDRQSFSLIMSDQG